MGVGQQSKGMPKIWSVEGLQRLEADLIALMQDMTHQCHVAERACVETINYVRRKKLREQRRANRGPGRRKAA